MSDFGFVRIGVAVPRVRVGNPKANVDEILLMLTDAARQEADIVLFPELCVTGYTCGDLFGQDTLLAASCTEIARLAKESSFFGGLIVVGAPFPLKGGLHNGAFAINRGSLRGVAVKKSLPNYREFYELRHFQPLADHFDKSLNTSATNLFGGGSLDYGSGLLLRCENRSNLSVGIEICEDLWVPKPLSSELALAGATVLLNLSASDELVAKSEYRRSLVVGQSARCLAAYAYAGAGVHESTQDLVYGGHSMIAENGVLLSEGKRFSRKSELTIADVDVDRLQADRRRTNTFTQASDLRTAGYSPEFTLEAKPRPRVLKRWVPAHPFVPSDPVTLNERCEEIFHIQTAGLAKRIETAGIRSLHIGVSGGLDSTLALLVAVRTCDLLGMPRTAVYGLTMPGFGTTEKTLANAESLMKHLQVSADRIDIRRLSMDSFLALRHKPFGLDPTGKSVEAFQQELIAVPPAKRKDLVFENIQARLRTYLLMNRGFVVGTGDLSELALGWCTYNGDHMSMYAVNVGVPKTLVKFLVAWAADNEFEGPARDVLHSIVGTEISPELLPAGSDADLQRTEDAIGPYELHDFFLYHVLRYGFGPAKILYLAKHAKFSKDYAPAEVRKWLRLFLQRFFANQFKRSCIPDGPKVGSVCLSPRGDWRMPSDADATAWLSELDAAED